MRWILLLALPAPAFACPTGADMANGVLLASSDGTTEVHKQAAAGLTIVDVTFSDGHQSQNTFIHGTFIKQLADVEDGFLDIRSALQTVYDTPPPIPAPGDSGVINTRSGSLADGMDAEVQTYWWGEVGEMTIGNCRYAAIEGVLTYRSDDSDVRETIAYLPELGIGLLTSYQDVGNDPETYTYLTITAQ